MKALLIIDMQAGSFSDIPRFESKKVIEIINAISKRYRENGDKVIFIQHDGSKENCFLPGTDEWQILPDLVTKKDDIFVHKIANDAFYKTNLESFLRTNAINDITITGCATDFCVEATIQSALVKDYNITIVKEGHTTADRPHANAKTVIDHYNWIWENMSPTQGKLEVIAFEDIILQDV